MTEPLPGRWAFLDTETGEWIEVKPGTVARETALEAAGEGYKIREWVHHQPSGVVVLRGHPQLGGRYCLHDGGDWPCAAVRAALAEDDAGLEIPDMTARRNGPVIQGQPCPWCGAMVTGDPVEHRRGHD